MKEFRDRPMRSNHHAALDERIADTLMESRVNFVCSVPCGLLSGLLANISRNKEIVHVPVTREEEGVGVCAGAYLGGARPALLMQNSGLGNSLNALLSLTGEYELGLILVIGYRGRREEEKIAAQIPMGEATEKLLSVVRAEFEIIESEQQIPRLKKMANRAFERGKIGAILLTPRLWEKN